MRVIQRFLKSGCIIVTNPKARLNFELINLFPVFSIKLYPRFYPFFAQGPVFQVVCVVAVYSENAKNKETTDFNKSL